MKNAAFFRVASSVIMATVISAVASPSRAQQAWYATGVGSKVSGAVKDYTVTHEVAKLQPGTTRETLIAEVSDKRFSWSLRRDIPCSRIQAELSAALGRAGASTADASAFLASCSGAVMKARSAVVIRFDAASHCTSFWVEGMGVSSVQGDAFMRSVWGVWLGLSEDPVLAASLVSRL